MLSRGLDSAMNVEMVRKQLQDRPLVGSSAGRHWDGISIDEYGAYRSDDKRLLSPRDHHVITISLGYSPYVFQERLGKTFESPCKRGETTMMPAGHEVRFRGLLPAHIRIGMTPNRLKEAAEELRRIGTSPSAELTNGFLVRDPWLENLGAIFSNELACGPHPAQTLLIDALANALSAHLLRNYSATAELVERNDWSGTAAAVGRAVDFIEAHSDRDMSLADLASAAGLSRYHLVRVFTRELGFSPMQYVQRSRIERAKVLIRAGDLSLAEIAYATGFSDQSHFTRRFKRHVGCTPSAYARQYGRLRLPGGPYR